MTCVCSYNTENCHMILAEAKISLVSAPNFFTLSDMRGKRWRDDQSSGDEQELIEGQPFPGCNHRCAYDSFPKLISLLSHLDSSQVHRSTLKVSVLSKLLGTQSQAHLKTHRSHLAHIWDSNVKNKNLNQFDAISVFINPPPHRHHCTTTKPETTGISLLPYRTSLT